MFISFLSFSAIEEIQTAKGIQFNLFWVECNSINEEVDDQLKGNNWLQMSWKMGIISFS